MIFHIYFFNKIKKIVLLLFSHIENSQNLDLVVHEKSAMKIKCFLKIKSTIRVFYFRNKKL